MRRLLAISILLVASVPARATADGYDAAAVFKQRGDEAMRAGQPADALAAYQRAYESRPDAALVYNMGRAYQALGDYPAALERMETFAKTAPDDLRAKVPGLDGYLDTLRGRVSTLALNVDVAGATVRLNDRTLGVTPLDAKRVVAGQGKLVVEKDGYFPYRADVTLPARGVATLDVKLSSKETEGVLVVRSPIAGAVASIDGKRAGTVPTEVVVGGGTHRVDVERDGYHAATSTVVVAAGEQRTVDVDLEREASIASKWWFWTAVGVAVVGGVVTVYALTTERDAGSGSVAPGHIKAGLSF